MHRGGIETGRGRGYKLGWFERWLPTFSRANQAALFLLVLIYLVGREMASRSTEKLDRQFDDVKDAYSGDLNPVGGEAAVLRQLSGGIQATTLRAFVMVAYRVLAAASVTLTALQFFLSYMTSRVNVAKRKHGLPVGQFADTLELTKIAVFLSVSIFFAFLLNQSLRFGGVYEEQLALGYPGFGIDTNLRDEYKKFLLGNAASGAAMRETNPNDAAVYGPLVFAFAAFVLGRAIAYFHDQQQVLADVSATSRITPDERTALLAEDDVPPVQNGAEVIGDDSFRAVVTNDAYDDPEAVSVGPRQYNSVVVETDSRVQQPSVLDTRSWWKKLLHFGEQPPKELVGFANPMYQQNHGTRVQESQDDVPPANEFYQEQEPDVATVPTVPTVPTVGDTEGVGPDQAPNSTPRSLDNVSYGYPRDPQTGEEGAPDVATVPTVGDAEGVDPNEVDQAWSLHQKGEYMELGATPPAEGTFDSPAVQFPDSTPGDNSTENLVEGQSPTTEFVS